MNINLYDLNKVTLQQLSSIPGIDEPFANAVLKYRKQHKGVKHFDELWKVNGISRSKYKILQRNVEVVGQEPLEVGSKLPYARESLETVNARVYQGFQKRREKLRKRAKSAKEFVARQNLVTSTPKVPRPSSQHQQRKKSPLRNIQGPTKQAFVSPVAEPVFQPSSTITKMKTKTPEQKPYFIKASPSGNKVTVSCNLNKRNKNDDSWMLLKLESGKGQRKIETGFESPVNEAASTIPVQYTHTQTQTPREIINERAKSVKQSYFDKNISTGLSSVRNGTPFAIHPPGLPSLAQRNLGNALLYRGDNGTQPSKEVVNKDRDRLINDTRNRLKNAKSDLRKIRKVNSPERLSELTLHEFEVQTYKTLGQKVRSIEQWIDDVEKETRLMYSNAHGHSVNNSNSNHSSERISKSIYPAVKSTNRDNTIQEPIATNKCISCQQPMTSQMYSPNESLGQLRREDLTTTDHRAAHEEETRLLHKRKPQELVKKDVGRERSPTPKSQKTTRSPRSAGKSGKGRREHKRESRTRRRQSTRHRPSHKRHTNGKKTGAEDACNVM